MRVTIRPMDRSDFPLIRDWIDTRLFRIFRDPIGDDQMEKLLTREEDGRPVDLGYVAVKKTGQDPVGFVHAVLDWKNELAHVQDEDNEPALELYRNLGFTRDGLMREATRTESGFVSWHCMSMLTGEWGGEHVEDDG